METRPTGVIIDTRVLPDGRIAVGFHHNVPGTVVGHADGKILVKLQHGGAVVAASKFLAF